MDSKLTLKLDSRIIERAKQYAASQDRSLSRLIESYLRSLLDNEPQQDDEISPYVNSLRTGVEVPSDLDYKQAYRDYVADKYR
ncbi:MAG: DUF6364 family protein [Cyclobacteriaceae bacterium]